MCPGQSTVSQLRMSQLHTVDSLAYRNPTLDGVVNASCTGEIYHCIGKAAGKLGKCQCVVSICCKPLARRSGAKSRLPRWSTEVCLAPSQGKRSRKSPPEGSVSSIEGGISYTWSCIEQQKSWGDALYVARDTLVSSCCLKGCNKPAKLTVDGTSRRLGAYFDVRMYQLVRATAKPLDNFALLAHEQEQSSAGSLGTTETPGIKCAHVVVGRFSKQLLWSG